MFAGHERCETHHRNCRGFEKRQIMRFQAHKVVRDRRVLGIGAVTARAAKIDPHFVALLEPAHIVPDRRNQPRTVMPQNDWERRFDNQVIISGRRKGHLAATVDPNPGLPSVELDVTNPTNIGAVTTKLIAEFFSFGALGAVESKAATDLPEEVQDRNNPYGFVGRDGAILKLER